MNVIKYRKASVVWSLFPLTLGLIPHRGNLFVYKTVLLGPFLTPEYCCGIPAKW